MTFVMINIKLEIPLSSDQIVGHQSECHHLYINGLYVFESQAAPNKRREATN